MNNMNRINWSIKTIKMIKIIKIINMVMVIMMIREINMIKQITQSLLITFKQNCTNQNDYMPESNFHGSYFVLSGTKIHHIKATITL